MPISSPRTASQTGLPADPLAGRLALARAVLTAEKLLPRLWPGLGFVGFYLALALTGIFAFTPWVLQALLLAATITAAALSLYEGFSDFAWPRAIDAARRLERDSGFVHRPVSERGDVLVGADPFAEELWRLHQARPLPGVYRIAPPRTGLAERDPQGLRWYLMIAIAVGLVMARGDTGQRLISAFESGAGAAASLDAWVDPPPYTGLPLFSLHAGDDTVQVPKGSILNLRVHGAPRRPGLEAGNNAAPRFAGEEGEYSSNVVLSTTSRVRVQVGGHAIGKWRIEALADTMPQIALVGKPGVTEQKATTFKFKGGDDYGITGAHALMQPRGSHGKPLVAELPLAESAARKLDQTAFVDLTSHPYAGLLVDGHLEARDAIGQKGRSATFSFRLPARVFTDPLARALVEQRQHLATADASGRQNVVLTLDALAIAPERFYEGKTDILLALRSAFYGVKNARTDKDIARIEDLLWQTALKLERGGLLSAAEELRKLQAQLMQAMASGAPQDVIDELLKRYNQAMQRYMQALKANPSAESQMAMPEGSKSLGEQDLATLLKAIQELTAAGERQKAAQLLAMLQSMLENMRVTQGQGGQGQGQQSPQDKKRNDAIQKFGGLMGKQRDLLDKTFRQQQGQSDPKDGGAQGLQKQQSDLEKELQDSLKGMDGKAAQQMREAGKSMGDAQNALGRKDLSSAGSAQNQALSALRQGAQQLADEASGSGRQGGGPEDPLGRSQSPLGNTGVKIPGAADLARARAILEELRRRAAQMNRAQAERDYLDRLLKAF